jgi:hypothetical protein
VNRYERRVRRGADYLNEITAERPGHRYADWINRIDLGSLDVDCEDHCVIGQLSRNFNYSIEARESLPWLLRRGFVVPGTSPVGLLVGWRGTKRFERRKARLREAWRSYIINERVRNRSAVH